MPQQFYPAILFPADADGLHGVIVPGVNVNASGSSQAEALADAAAILQELIDDLGAAGQAVPAPLAIDQLAGEGGQILLIPANLPGRTTRINVTIDEELVRRIDAVTRNRSSFLASAARAQLAASRA